MTANEATEARLEAIAGLLDRMEVLIDRLEDRHNEVRTRRLVVVDAEGRDRVVLDGGPFEIGDGASVADARFEMMTAEGDRTVIAQVRDGSTSFEVLTSGMVPGEINQACFAVYCADAPSEVGESTEPHVLVATLDAYNQWDNISTTLRESSDPIEERGHQRQIGVLRACVSELMQSIEPAAE